MDKPDVLIIGAGIIGCSLARVLAKEKQKVLILDQGRAGEASSSAAAGLLSPTLAASSEGPLADLCFQSADRYESWLAELREEGVGDFGFRRAGMIELITDLQQTPKPDHRRRTETLTRADLRRMEPAVAAEVAGALFYQDDSQVDAPSISRQVARAAELAGVTIHQQEAVHRLVVTQDRITAIQAGKDRYDAGVVILTAGAWSGKLLEPLGISLPTFPVKGQLLTADCRISPVRTPLHAGEGLFIPRPDGRLTLGVTVENAGFDNQVTLAGLQTILNKTRVLVPAVDDLPFGRAWAGLRPATPDGLPYMGPVASFKNLWISTGHFRKGILLAPICAQLMAKSILAEKLVSELQPYSPQRVLK